MDVSPKSSMVQMMRTQIAQTFSSLQKNIRNNPLAAIITFMVLVYIVAVMVYRFSGIASEFAADPDQRQAVFHYWRYHISGAFPPGDLLTDYAFVMHAPPLWWIMMAPLSLVFEPITAAILLNIFAFAATCIAAYLCCRAFTSHLPALAGAILIAHSCGFHLVTAGGYARTFGPLLVLMFMAGVMHKRHKTTLVILVIQAGLYPSVVIPCGIAYGIYCIFIGDSMAARIRRTLEVSLTGVVVILLGLFQSFGAPDWWGSVVWESEAIRMPVWGSGGRINEAPLGNPAKIIGLQLERAFLPIGHQVSEKLSEIAMENNAALQFIIIGLMLAFVVVRKRKFPLMPLGMLLAAFAAYFLARAMAFKLYLPYRPLTHVLPYALYILIPCLAFAIAKDLFNEHSKKVSNKVAILALLIAIFPTLFFAGDGLGDTPRRTYGSYAKNKDLFKFVRQTPLDAVYAGSFAPTDVIPLFGYHAVYMNRVMAHPFRKGLYAEVERRVENSYNALYATTPCDLVKLNTEDVSYFVYQKNDLRRLDSKLFEPVKKRLALAFTKGKRRGFFLKRIDSSMLAYKGKRQTVVDLAKVSEKYGETCASNPSSLEKSASPILKTKPALLPNFLKR